MKIKEGFVLRKVAGENVVVAVGPACKILNGIIRLNGSGAFLWDLMKDGAEEATLIQKLQEEYGIDESLARQDIHNFMSTLSQAGCLE